MVSITTTHTGIEDRQWQDFQREGWLSLGRVLEAQALAALQRRIDEIMLGTAAIDYQRLIMQLDSSTGDYSALGRQTVGHKGATLNYRKIEGLETDPLFSQYMRLPLFADIARRAYPGATVALHRAMFMNKPAGQGTVLPMHQDRWKRYDRDPQLTLYTALDAASSDNGCVEIVPRSHAHLINPAHASGFLTAEQAVLHAPPQRRLPLCLQAGEVVLLHNWTLHGSDINRSQHSRRAFSVCLMDAATRIAETGEPTGRPVLFAPQHDQAAITSPSPSLPHRLCP